MNDEQQLAEDPDQAKGDPVALPTPEVNEKLARIGQSLSSEKLDRLFKNKPSPAIQRILDLQADMAARMPVIPDIAVSPMVDFDFTNTPEMRAARAAEQTAELIEALVEASVTADARAFEAEARAVEVEARENKMLELTITNTKISKIAAISGVVGVLVGIVAIVVTILFA
jgi:hypothetical protein